MHTSKRKRLRRLAPWEIGIRIAGVLAIPAAGIALGLLMAWVDGPSPSLHPAPRTLTPEGAQRR